MNEQPGVPRLTDEWVGEIVHYVPSDGGHCRAAVILEVVEGTAILRLLAGSPAPQSAPVLFDEIEKKNCTWHRRLVTSHLRFPINARPCGPREQTEEVING